MVTTWEPTDPTSPTAQEAAQALLQGPPALTQHAERVFTRETLNSLAGEGVGSDPSIESAVVAAAMRWARWHVGLPALYRNADVSGLREGQHRAEVSAWVNGGDAARNLLLVGGIGTGKTWTAYAAASAAAAAAACTRGPHVRAWTLPSLLDALRPSSDQSERVWDQVKDAGVLVLDDIGHTRPTEWAVERLWMLVDHRTVNDARTVVTTNADSRTLADVWGAATMDRLQDRATVLKFAGESMRRRAW